MIVQVQGTSGSGKSTLVRELMKWATKRGGTVRPILRNGKVVDYCVALSARSRIYLIGKYETPCGGCDQVGSWAEVLRRVRSYSGLGHVVFEGLLLSGGQGSLGRNLLKYYGDRFAYAFLDTPLEVCLARVQQRRVARAAQRGVAAEPLNPKNTTAKWHACHRYRERALGLGYRCVALLPHRRPLPGLLKLLGVRP